MGEATWAWVTSDQVLAKRSCKLHYAALDPSAAGADVTIYNGENSTEPPVVRIDAAAKTLVDFKPPQPVRCDRGLFVDVGSNVTGVFVQYELEG